MRTSSTPARPRGARQALHHGRSALLPAAVAAFVAACAVSPSTHTGTEPAAQRVITAETIERSRSTNAWDLLREHAVINMAQTDSRGQYRVQSRRGRSSVVLGGSDVPMVVVDGVRVIEMGTLRQIPSEIIRSIRVLGPIEGTTYMGTNAGAGVIVIETSAARP